MASRARQKQEARHVAQEEARLERGRRRRRVRVLGGVVLAAVAVVAVAIALSSSGGGSSGLRMGSGGAKLAAQVQQMLRGIPQSGVTLGNPKAPVTMTYYSDLQCPVCADFTLNSGFGELLAKDVRAGRVKIVYRSLETATRDLKTFQTQQVAALAAGTQNRFWDYIELFYRQQGAEGTGYVTDGYLTGLAHQIPKLNISTWRSARTDSALISQLQSDLQAASAAGVRGTPTLIFEGPRGTAQAPEPVPSYDQLEQAIKSVA